MVKYKNALNRQSIFCMMKGICLRAGNQIMLANIYVFRCNEFKIALSSVVM